MQRENALVPVVNGTEAYTLLSLCKLARGIFFLPVRVLAAAGTSSLSTSGKRYVSRVCHDSFYLADQSAVGAINRAPTILDYGF